MGRIVLKSITSALIPSLANSSAASKATFMIFPKETMVTSLPSFTTLAEPSGVKYSPSGTSPLSPYICSDSIKITGSSSRIADFNKPFASAGFEGTTTFNQEYLRTSYQKLVSVALLIDRQKLLAL